MKLNLALDRRIYVPSGSYKSLTETQLRRLVDTNTTSSGVSISAGETLSVVCELGARYETDFISYYRSAASVENIAFFGRQGEGPQFPLIGLNYTVSGTEIRVDLASLPDKYQSIQLSHTVITGTAEAFELDISVESDTVLFGFDGQVEVVSMDSGTGTLEPEKVFLYNNTSTQKKIHCLIDASYPPSSALSLSNYYSGPFYSLYNSGISFPLSFPWVNGSFENTEVKGASVGLLSASVSGTFFSPVIDISTLEGRRLFWEYTTSGTAVIDNSLSLDSKYTVGVRMSSQQPSEGGWSSGQLSIDYLWSTVSGTLPFSPFDNDHLLHPDYKDYIQFRVEFWAPAPGQTALLHRVGVEEATSVVVPPHTSSAVYVKSDATEHVVGSKAGIVSWYFDGDNERQQW